MLSLFKDIRRPAVFLCKITRKIGMEFTITTAPRYPTAAAGGQKSIEKLAGNKMQDKVAVRQLHSGASRRVWAGKVLLEGTNLDEL